MGVDVKTSGIDNALKRLVAQKSSIERKAVREAAKHFSNRLKDETPRYDGKSYPSSNNVHLENSITMSNFKDDQILVGFNKETAWRVHFIEYGTIKQKPNGFIERTIQSSQKDILEIMQNEIKKGLGL